MKKLFFPFVLLFTASVIFTGCRSDDPEVIIVEDNDTLDQTVYADDETGESGVSFTTFAPWYSFIRETTNATTATTTRNAVDWVSINPESGGAGTHTIVISLEPNFSGADRSAIITIVSAGTAIEIRITQQGETEGGYVPQPDDPSIIRAENIIGDDFSEVVSVRVMSWYWDSDVEEDRTFILAEAPFVNNGFTLQLTNDIPESVLQPLYEAPDNFVVSDKNAKLFALMYDWPFAFDSNGDIIGRFILADMISENEAYIAIWLYADRDVTLKGTSLVHECCCERLEESWDVDLRRGWNIVYLNLYRNFDTRTGKNSYTTQRPAGMNLRWHFYRWNFEDWSSHSAKTQGVESRRSIFGR